MSQYLLLKTMEKDIMRNDYVNLTKPRLTAMLTNYPVEGNKQLRHIAEMFLYENKDDFTNLTLKQIRRRDEQTAIVMANHEKPPFVPYLFTSAIQGEHPILYSVYTGYMEYQEDDISIRQIESTVAVYLDMDVDREALEQALANIQLISVRHLVPRWRSYDNLTEIDVYAKGMTEEIDKQVLTISRMVNDLFIDKIVEKRYAEYLTRVSLPGRHL